MIAMKCTVNFDAGAVNAAVKRGNVSSLGQAGAYVRGIAMRSIKVDPNSAPAGHQPYTREGRLKKGIVYAVERANDAAVIGPTASEVGLIGHTHEFGGVEPPKTPPVLRQNNWLLRLGGHGPIRTTGGGHRFARLLTVDQVIRAEQIGAQLIGAAQEQLIEKLTKYVGKPRHYPARPFMAPALEIAIASGRLPQLWANSIGG